MNLNIFKFNSKNRKEINAAVLKAVNVLKSGGIVVHPTDTCYGIAADITNRAAVEKVYNFKGRDYNKPLSIIVGDFEQFKKYGTWHPLVEEMITKNPKKQFTFVVKRKQTVPSYLNSDFSTIGMQIPKYKLSLAMLKKLGSPLTATSANFSGMPNNYSVEDLLIQLKSVKNYPDLILDGGRLLRRAPSSVVEVGGKTVKVLR